LLFDQCFGFGFCLVGGGVNVGGYIWWLVSWVFGLVVFGLIMIFVGLGLMMVGWIICKLGCVCVFVVIYE